MGRVWWFEGLQVEHDRNTNKGCKLSVQTRLPQLSRIWRCKELVNSYKDKTHIYREIRRKGCSLH